MSSTSGPTAASSTYKYLLALGALGVVYGDIGTSPLYAIKESFHHGNNIQIGPDNVLGMLSLIFWALTLMISIKYITFILKADNKGEGGILALTSLINPKTQTPKGQLTNVRRNLILLGLFGTALIVGDGMITPAISILSAVEGLELITPVFKPYIIPITIGILVGLFSFQKKGTSIVGRTFGPVMLVWYSTLALLGVISIVQTPEVLLAINPLYIVDFFVNNTWYAFFVLGSVFLVITGGEALYSDLGHFGREPIKMAWFYIALPGLLLNYFGQGALLLRDPSTAHNPFFLLAPDWALYPMVILATMATVVASQALITGVFSLAMQAVQNGYLPRVHIAHTSSEEFGQIYVKNMNRLLMIGSIGLILTFKSSSNLVGAYGLAVTTTMVITTLLFYVVLTERWKWKTSTALMLCAGFLIIDLAFWSANILKFFDGGWFPVFIGVAGFIVMTTWFTGRRHLRILIQKKIMPLADFLEILKTEKAHRTDGAAVYLNRNVNDTPYALIHTYEHFKTVHKNLIFLSVISENIPRVSQHNRVSVSDLGNDNFQIILRYGYIEQPDIPRDIVGLKLGSYTVDINSLSFIIGKESLYATQLIGMAIWREKIFSWMSKNQIPATDYFQLPRDRVVEVGVQIAI